MLTMALRKKQDVLTTACFDMGYQQKQTVAQFLQVSHYIVGEWFSYDHTWFSGPDKQEILIHTIRVSCARLSQFNLIV
jgi:hypothetical protein